MAFNENNTSACLEDPNLTSCDYSYCPPDVPIEKKVFGLSNCSYVTDTASEGGSPSFSRDFGIETTSLDSSKSNKCPSQCTSHFCQTPMIREHSIKENYSKNNSKSISNQHRYRNVDYNRKYNIHANNQKEFITSPSLQQKSPILISSNECPTNATKAPKYCCSLAKEKTTSKYLSLNPCNDCRLDAFGNESCEIITRSSAVNCDINLNKQRSIGSSSPVSLQSSSQLPFHNGYQSSESPDLNCIVEKEKNMNVCFTQKNSTSIISGCNGNLPNQPFSSKKGQKLKDKNGIQPKNKSASSRKFSNQMCKCSAKGAPCVSKSDDGTSSPNFIPTSKNAVENLISMNDIWEYLKEQDEKLNQIYVTLNEKQSFSHADKGGCDTSEEEARTINSCSDKLQRPKNTDSQKMELEHNFVLTQIRKYNQQIHILEDQINLLKKRVEELESFKSTRDKTADGPERFLISKQCQTNDLESDREIKVADKSPVVKHRRTSDLENPSSLLISNRENKLANEITSPKDIFPIYKDIVRHIDARFPPDDDKDNLKSLPSKRTTSSGTKVKHKPHKAYSRIKRKHKSRKSPLRRSSSESSNTSVDFPCASPQCKNNAIDSDIDEQLHEPSNVSIFGLSDNLLSIATKQYLEDNDLVCRKSSSRHEEKKGSSNKSKLPSHRRQFR